MTDTVTADDPADRYPHLEQFLAGWFHQDWVVGGRGWEPVVADYLAESPRASVAATRSELASLLAESDEALESVLDGLGCSLEPTAFGLSARAWLEQVRDRLQA